MGLCLGFGAIAVLSAKPEGLRPDIRMILSGADISLSGGSKIVMQGRWDTWTQTCNGPCDDLTILSETADLGYSPTIYDAQGRYLLREGGYLESGKVVRTVSGQPKLTSNIIWNFEPASNDKYWPIGEPGS